MELKGDSNRTATVRIIDLVSNDTFYDSLFLPKIPFWGNFNITWGNVISPEQDGFNDLWLAIDSSRLGIDTLRYGYNIYKYWVNLFQREAGRYLYFGDCEYDQNGNYIEEENRGSLSSPRWHTFQTKGYNIDTGFGWKDIQWGFDTKAEYCNWVQHPNAPYTLFGTIWLKNCDHDGKYTFVLTVFCSASSPIPLGINDLDSLSDVILYPNPTNSLINLKLTSKNQSVYLYNSNGAIIYFKEQNDMDFITIDLSKYAKGLYNLVIEEKNKVIINKKIILN